MNIRYLTNRPDSITTFSRKGSIEIKKPTLIPIFFQQIDDSVIEYPLNNPSLKNVSNKYQVIFGYSGGKYIDELTSRFPNAIILRSETNSYYEKWKLLLEHLRNNKIEYHYVVRTCIDSLIVDCENLVEIASKEISSGFDFIGNRDNKKTSELNWIRGGCNIVSKRMISKFNSKCTKNVKGGYDEWITATIKCCGGVVKIRELFECGDVYSGVLPVWHPQTKDLSYQNWKKIAPLKFIKFQTIKSNYGVTYRYNPLYLRNDKKINNPKIGIGITTRNRNSTFLETYSNIKKFEPPNSKIIVIDDASDCVNEHSTFKFRHNVGIARSKNKCIDLLYDCDYIFLFDDDCYPIKDKWWSFYIDSGFHHLSYTYSTTITNKSKNLPIFTFDNYRVFPNPRGCMLFITKTCINEIGGFKNLFKKYGHEHVEYSLRSYKKNLIPYPFIDIENSDSLFKSLDRFEEIKSSVDKKEIKIVPIGNENYDDSFQEFSNKMESFTILCSYFTGVKDSQRGEYWKPDISVLDTLINSTLDSNGNIIIFHDCFDVIPDYLMNDKIQFLKRKIDSDLTPYNLRWIIYYDYLLSTNIDNPIFIVDSTDVEVLKSPSEINRNKIYIGYEYKNTLQNTWLIEKEEPYIKSIKYKTDISKYRNKSLLNCGILGGYQLKLMEILKMLVTNINSGDFASNIITEMALMNYTIYKHFEDSIIYGDLINTKFKQFEYNNISWFRHK